LRSEIATSQRMASVSRAEFGAKELRGTGCNHAGVLSAGSTNGRYSVQSR
jgi:hypothetical protein